MTTIGAPGCQTLARLTTGEAALVDCAPGKGRALVFASDFDNEWNDFPLHSAFVPFLHESVRYLAGGTRPAGEYLGAAAPAGVPAKPGIATRAQPADAGGTARRVAINVDPAESEQGRLSAEEFQTAVTRLKDVSRSAPHLEASQQEEHQRIWQYVLAVMIATMIGGTFVAGRMVGDACGRASKWSSITARFASCSPVSARAGAARGLPGNGSAHRWPCRPCSRSPFS